MRPARFSLTILDMTHPLDKSPQSSTPEHASDANSTSRSPKRRCICCRGNGGKYALLRFVVAEHAIYFDLRQKLPGRGFYVCAQKHCLEKAFASAFRRVTKCGPQNLGDSCEAFVSDILLPGLRKRASELLRAGMQSRQLLLGAEGVELAAKNDTLGCYVLATDASAATAQKYRANATRKGLPCIELFDRTYYGRLFGKSDKVVLGWIPGTLCEEFYAIAAAIGRLDPTMNTCLTASDKG